MEKTMIKMSKLDATKTIFNLFLCFLTEKGVNILLRHCLREPNGTELAKRINQLLRADERELRELIARGGDEEDIVAYLNVFLWKQKIGKIEKHLRIKYDFEEPSNAWLVHRQMVANGYEGIASIEYRVGGNGGVTTYEQEIEKYLGFHKQDPTSYVDDDYFSWLATNLNVIGPKIKSFQRLPEVIEFVEYVLLNINKDKRLEWLTLSSFTMLVYDLSYPEEKNLASLPRNY
jgi:hypothetical protein